MEGFVGMVGKEITLKSEKACRTNGMFMALEGSSAILSSSSKEDGKMSIMLSERGTCRVELTLKTKKATRFSSVEEIPKGALVKGTVKRVEPFGVFVALEGSTLSGLAHVSQVSDVFVKNIKDLFSVGQGIAAASARC